MKKADLRTLKAELSDDPESLGYDGKTHEELAAILNTPQRSVERNSFTGGMLAACIDKDEYEQLTDKSYVTLLTTASGDIPVTRAIRKALKGIFPQGSDTRKDIVDLLKRSGSRAEELGLSNVTASDVADALLRTD